MIANVNVMSAGLGTSHPFVLLVWIGESCCSEQAVTEAIHSDQTEVANAVPLQQKLASVANPISPTQQYCRPREVLKAGNCKPCKPAKNVSLKQVLLP